MRFFFFFALLLSLPADAHVRTMADSGRPLYWTSPSFTMQGNPQNSSGMSDAAVNTQLSAAFAAWSVPGTNAQAVYSQSRGVNPNSNMDGINTVYFASAAGRTMDYGVIALTEVTYYLSSGQIAEADMAFNDNQFLFTANEGDTGHAIGGKVAIYLRDVATHEAGHAFGIDHSIVNLASLVYTAFSGQFVLSNDDKTAIRSMYPSASGNGSLTGSVRGRNGGIFGAQVEAINLATGSVQDAALSNPDGSFRIGDIPPGQYAVLMEPYGADIYSISSYYQNVNHRFCGGNKFRRRFYGACGSNSATVVEVAADRGTDLGTLSPSCSQMGNPAGAPTTLAGAADFPIAGGAKFGTLRPGDTHYYRVHGVAGNLKAKAVAYALYSPVDVKVEILDSAGNALAGATSVDNVQNPMPGGFINYDASAEATVTSGDYIIRVRAAGSRLSSSLYAAGFDLLDADGHYLLALSVDGLFGASTTSDMSSCATVSNTTQAASYRMPASINNDDDKGGGCGTLGNPGGGGGGGGGLTQLLAVAVLLQAFRMALAMARRQKAALVRKRR